MAHPPAPPPTRIYLVRHGTTLLNRPTGTAATRRAAGPGRLGGRLVGRPTPPGRRPRGHLLQPAAPGPRHGPDRGRRRRHRRGRRPAGPHQPRVRRVGGADGGGVPGPRRRGRSTGYQEYGDGACVPRRRVARPGRARASSCRCGPWPRCTRAGRSPPCPTPRSFGSRSSPRAASSAADWRVALPNGSVTVVRRATPDPSPSTSTASAPR